MVVYDIVVDYRTGDSFSDEDIYGESVGIVTTDVAKAQENLYRIKEHYKKALASPNVDYRLTLLTDDGERHINPFWIGFFEELYNARIVVEDIDE